MCAPVARKRSVSAYGTSFVDSGMRKLSPIGEALRMPEFPSSVSHSSSIPSRFQEAAFVGAAERKNCCHALVLPMANVRSQIRFVLPCGQSAAKALKSFHDTNSFVVTTLASNAAFVGLIPPRIFPFRSKPVSSRSINAANAFVPPNQWFS